MNTKQRLKMFKLKQKFVRIPTNYKLLKKIHNKIITANRPGGEWMTPPLISMVKKARKYIGYSDATASVDIINALYKASRSAS